MKLRDKVFLWVGGVSVLLYMYYRYILAQYSFKFDSIAVNSITDKEIDLNLMFKVSSNIGVAFVVNGIDAEVSLNGILIGTISKSEQITIPSGTSQIISIPFNVDLEQLKANGLSDITTLIFASTKSITVIGSSSVAVSGLPFNISIDINETINF